MREVFTGCAAAAIVLVLCAEAQAKPVGLGLDLGATGASQIESEGSRALSGTGFLNAQLFLGRRVGWSGSADVELGAFRPAGFVYGLEILPLGVGLRFAERGWLYGRGGIGVSGIAGQLPVAAKLPAAVGTSLDVGSWVRVSAEARVAWVGLEDSRKDGTDTIAFADELQLTLGIAIAERQRDHMETWSDGTFLGVRLEEFAGVRMVSAIIAVQIHREVRR